MNPDLENFLEDAFSKIQPSSPAIGRVVVEPDYEVTQAENDAAELTRELTQLLQQQDPTKESLASPHGTEVQIPEEFPLLARYFQRITLHANRVEGPWIEVAPPGNWI